MNLPVITVCGLCTFCGKESGDVYSCENGLRGVVVRGVVDPTLPPPLWCPLRVNADVHDLDSIRRAIRVAMPAASDDAIDRVALVLTGGVTRQARDAALAAHGFEEPPPHVCERNAFVNAGRRPWPMKEDR